MIVQCALIMSSWKKRAMHLFFSFFFFLFPFFGFDKFDLLEAQIQGRSAVPARVDKAY